MSFIALCVLYLPARWPPNIALMSNRGGNFKFMTYADQFHALTQQDGTMTTPQLVLSLPDRRPEQHGLPLNPIRSSSPLAQSDFLWKSWFGALVIMREYFMNASPKFAALMQTQLIGLAKTLVIILHERYRLTPRIPLYHKSVYLASMSSTIDRIKRYVAREKLKSVGVWQL